MSDLIKVEDEMPPLKVRVMVFDKDGFGVLSGRLGSAGWYLEGMLDTGANITHWMPLMEGPKL